MALVKSVTVTNHVGDSLTMDFADILSTGFVITNIEGIGFDDADINMNEYAIIDGAKHSMSRKAMREITLTMAFSATDTETIEALRHKCYRFFPTKQEVTLRFVTSERDCWIKGFVKSNTPTIFTSQEYVAIVIDCPDPYFTDSQENWMIINPHMYAYTTTSVSEIYQDVESPFPFECKITMISAPSAADAGSRSGMVKFKVITNNSEHYIGIDLSRLNNITHRYSRMELGDVLTINAAPGKKQVYLTKPDGTSVNVIGCMSEYGKWPVFDIAANTVTISSEDNLLNTVTWGNMATENWNSKKPKTWMQNMFTDGTGYDVYKVELNTTKRYGGV